MLRRVSLIILIVIFIFVAIIGNCWAEQWEPFHYNEGWRTLAAMPLPSEYKDYRWLGGCDFSHIQNTMMPAMKGLKWVGNITFWAAMSCFVSVAVSWLIGGTAVGVGGAGGITQAETARIAAEEVAKKAAKEVAFYSAIGNVFGEAMQRLGFDVTEFFLPCSVQEMERKIKHMKSDLGISDYYAFGKAYNYQKGVTTLPLGAWINLRIAPTKAYFNMGYPSEFRIIYEKWPRVIRLKIPKLDFADLDSRVWEQNISGESQPITLQRLFAYERLNSEKKLSTQKEKFYSLRIEKSDSIKEGGKIIGEISFKYLPGLGIAGLREVYLCSPINEGLKFKDLDDYTFAIVTNKETVTVTGPSLPVNIGEEILIKVKIEGFHKKSAPVLRPDGGNYQYKDVADAIFRGTYCQGAGVQETHIEHDLDTEPTVTLLKCTPTKSGKVQVILPTRQGPVVWEEVATVLPDEKKEHEKEQEEVTQEEKGLPIVTAIVQEAVKTPAGWYYQVVISVEKAKFALTWKEEWEKYPDETQHYSEYWKAPTVMEVGEKITLSIQIVRPSRLEHDLIEHRIIWHGIDENNNKIELETVFSPSGMPYKDWTE